MAKIELKSKPIQEFEFMGKYAPQHLYIVHTKDSGERIAYRGGPEQGNYHKDIKGKPFRDNLKVSKVAYDRDHPDFPKEGASHPTALILEGNDQLVDPYARKMESRPMRWINEGNFDYKVLLGQNSNAAARELIEGVGLKFALPKYEDGTEVIAPQWDATIEHSVIDKAGLGEKYLALYDKCQELSKKHAEQVEKISKEMREKTHKEEEKIDKKIAEATAMLNSAKTALTTEGAEAPRNTEQDYCNLGANMAASSKTDLNALIKSLLASLNKLRKDKKEKNEELKEEEKEKLRDTMAEYGKKLKEAYNTMIQKIKQQKIAEQEEEINKLPFQSKVIDLKPGMRQETKEQDPEEIEKIKAKKEQEIKEAVDEKISEYNKNVEEGVNNLLNTFTNENTLNEAKQFIAREFDLSFLEFTDNDPFESTLFAIKKEAEQSFKEKVDSMKQESLDSVKSEFEEKKKEIIDRKQKDLAEAWKNLPPQECKTESIAPGMSQRICNYDRPEEYDPALRHAFGHYYPWEKEVQEQLQTELASLNDELKERNNFGFYGDLSKKVEVKSLEESSDLLRSIERAFIWETNQAGWDLLTPELDNLELEIQQMLEDFKPSDEPLHTEDL